MDPVTQAAPPVAYTIAEAAERLRCSRTHIYALIKRGDLRRVRIGSRSIIPASEIVRLLAQGTE